MCCDAHRGRRCRRRHEVSIGRRHAAPCRPRIRRMLKAKLIAITALVGLVGHDDESARRRTPPSTQAHSLCWDLYRRDEPRHLCLPIRRQLWWVDTGSVSPPRGAARPSFLTSSANGRVVFAVNELQSFRGAASGSVASMTVGHGEAHRGISIQPTRGAGRAISRSMTGRYLAVADCGGGDFALPGRRRWPPAARNKRGSRRQIASEIHGGRTTGPHGGLRFA